ncbi:MAG TPA: signal peptide peptidase SppA [Thiolapillus brandeum]|uniref:Signal peptide peptidase SppA n=1 Tax=Thiolapillus brandeum TaxID=1076588 RepID=A0A831RZ41_9GAMM|nr:signal peptide peptidase SppA [Thiolapillus brandeum]
MKSFLKTVFASFTGMILVLLVLAVLIGTMLTAKETPQPIEDKTLLTLNLGVPIVDRQPRQKFASVIRGALQDRKSDRQSLRAVVTALRKAAKDDRISGLYIKGNVVRDGYASGWAALKEVRKAIEAFKASGKPVITWQESLDEATLYVVSTADRLVLNPLGLLEFNGFASEVPYFRNAFEKYGIDVQVSRVGKYKSAVEPFLLDHMSEENREQLDMLLNDLFDEVVAAVANSRNLPVSSLHELAQKEAVVEADQALKRGLVTAVGYYDVVREKLEALTGTEAGKAIENQKSVSDYFATLTKDDKAKDKLAVIYAEGDIISGSDKDQVSGDYIASLLRKARTDDDVKAVVLRVNSPGGSASASDIIQRETILLAKKKPLVISMGAVAASGGYWISAYGDEIYAEPNTITGSIGVFGLFLNVQKLVNELGVKVEVARTAPAADVFSLFRPKTPQEMAIIQKFIDHIYAEFLDKVAEGRKLDRAAVHEIAQGRVWSGKRALELGLVDKLGGLEDAMASAAKRANLDSYAVEEYQKEGTLLEELMKEMGMEVQLRQNPLVDTTWKQVQYLLSLTDAKGIYARMPYDLIIH